MKSYVLKKEKRIFICLIIVLLCLVFQIIQTYCASDNMLNVAAETLPFSFDGIEDTASEIEKNQEFSVKIEYGTGVIIVAQYNERGALLSVQIDEQQVSTSANPEAKQISIMLFNDLERMVPLCESKKLKVVEKLVETTIVDEDFDNTSIEDVLISGSNAEIDSGTLSLGDLTSYTTSFDDQTQSGTISFDLKYEKSSGYVSMYFGDSIKLFLSGGNLGSHLGDVLEFHSILKKSQWYNIVVDYNSVEGKYDVIVDGEVVGAGIRYRANNSFSGFTLTSHSGNNIVFDNFTIVSRNRDIKNIDTNATIQATADTYIGMNGAVAVNGYKDDVVVTRDNGASEKLSFFKFVAPEIPEDKRAYLNLWLNNADCASDSEMFTIYATETNWDEDLASSDEPVKLIDTIGRRIFQDGEEKKWIKFDITDYVRKNSGKEISLSVRGNSVLGSSTLNFDSIESTFKPSILVYDAISALDKEVSSQIQSFNPIETEVSFSVLPNTSAKIKEKSEMNMYVIGNSYADIAVNHDIYGVLARRLAEQFEMSVNYINRAMSGLVAQDAVKEASKLMEDQIPDIIVVDFDSISDDEAQTIIDKYRNINRRCEFIFVGDMTSIEDAGVLVLSREELIGMVPTNISLDNLFKNGSFEAPTYSLGQEIINTEITDERLYNGPGVTVVADCATEGNQALEISAGKAVRQAVTGLTIGEKYVFSADLKNTEEAKSFFQLSLYAVNEGESSFEKSINTGNFNGKKEAVFEFTAQTDVYRFKIENCGSGTMYLDNVRVRKVIEEGVCDVGEYIKYPENKSSIKIKDSQTVIDYFSMDDGVDSKVIFENQKHYFSAEEDNLTEGKYLRVKKHTARGYAGGEYFITPLGGDVRLDFQVCIFSPDTEIEMLLHPEGRQSVLTQIIFRDGVLSVGDHMEKVAELDCNKWYNITILLDMHNNQYDVLLNDEIAVRNVKISQKSGTLGSLQFKINTGKIGDFAIDSLRSSYYTSEESDKVRVVFKDDFDRQIPGELSAGTAGAVSYVQEGENIFVHADRINETGICNTRFNFSEVKSDISLNLDFKLNEDSYATKLMYIAGDDDRVVVPIFFNECKLKISDPEYADNQPTMEKLSEDEWHHLQVVTDLEKQKYFVYIDNMQVGMKDGYNFMGDTVTKFTGFRFSISARVGTCDIDNLIIKTTDGLDTANSDVARVIFDSDFDNKTPGLFLKGDAGTLSYVQEGTNIFVHADRTATAGRCTTYYAFDEVESNISFDVDFRLNDDSYATKLMYIMSDLDNIAIPIFFSEGKLKINDDAYANEQPAMSKLAIDEWHHLQVVTDIANQKYKIFVNGIQIGLTGGYEFANAPVKKFSGFRFSISAMTGTYDIDDVVVKTLGDGVDASTVEKKVCDGYDPINVDAPENNAWIEKYRRNPIGEIYEAEDMQLYNYEAYTDYNFHNQKGIKVSGTGAGTASFTYNGESGYKRIDLGYLEEDGEYDSHFYVYQNDELIDWFVCQNDQVGRYNRTSKEYWYVKKGDKFTIRGTHGEEPAELDYVEFSEGKRAAFKFGTVAEGINKAMDYHLQSSWNAREEGGWASSGLTMRDTSSSKSVELERRLPGISSNYTIQYMYTPYAYSEYNVLVGYSDGQSIAYPIDVRFEGRNIIINGTEHEDVLKKGKASSLRFAVDTDNKTYTLVADSVVVEENVPFACDIPEFNVFKFKSDENGTAYFKAHPFIMEAGYVFKEDFFCESQQDIELYNWQVNGSTFVVSDSASRYDPYHRGLNENASIRKKITPQSGVITFETQIIFPEKKDGSRVAIGKSGSGEIALYTDGGNICYDDGNGGSGVVWENYKPDVWYEYKFEIDMTNHNCKFFVNSFNFVETSITDKLTLANYIKISSGSNQGKIWVDDIAVFNGTYLDDNEVPEIEVPEGYGDYNVIMQTCDLWSEGDHFGYDLLQPWASRTPFLGYYEDGNPEVIDWQTKYMVEHGINVYAPCWYVPNKEDVSSPPLEPRHGAALNQGFMNSKYQDKIKFTLCLCSAGTSEGEENFYKYFVNYWIEHYFKHPSYFKVDNKPVIMVVGTDEFSEPFGDRQQEVFEQINQMLQAEGFDGAIFAGSAEEALSSKGWQYSYSYTLGAMDDGYRNIVNINKYASQSGTAPYIPTVSQGWGNEAWGLQYRKVNVPIKDFKACLEWVKNVYMPAYADDPLLKNTIAFDNWNEYCEGHSLAPTNLAGFGYLDAIRDVFTTADKEHADIVPEKRFDANSAMLR